MFFFYIRCKITKKYDTALIVTIEIFVRKKFDFLFYIVVFPILYLLGNLKLTK